MARSAIATAVSTARPAVPLGLRGVSKQFGGFAALTDLSVTFVPGEIHAVCGENGAGKSTLVKILSGLLQPSQGSVVVDGHPMVIDGSRRAQDLGIAVVAQELSLCGALSVFDNIWLGSARVPLFHRRADLKAKAQEVLDLLGLGHLDLSTPAGALRLGERQLVEIARALARDARVLILDEPTATLSDVEIERLFSALKALRIAGRSILYISHRLNEIFALCDTVTVLRNGRLISTGPSGSLTRDSLVEQMLGRSLGDLFHPYRPALEGTVVTIRHLKVPDRVTQFDAAVHGGSILCIAGQVGSGATDVIDALAGLIFDADGEVLVGDRAIPLGSTAHAIERGVMLVSGDRAREGIFLDLSVRDNLTATSLDRFASLGVLSARGLSRFAVDTGRALGIDASRMAAPARTLSGGNQQKLAFGRTIGRAGFGVLLMSEPTRGVDVGARAEIYALMRRFCDRGWALILTSTDLEEIIGLGDQVVTMFRGRAVGHYRREDLSMGRLVADITHPDTGVAATPAVVQ